MARLRGQYGVQHRLGLVEAIEGAQVAGKLKLDPGVLRVDGGCSLKSSEGANCVPKFTMSSPQFEQVI